MALPGLHILLFCKNTTFFQKTKQQKKKVLVQISPFVLQSVKKRNGYFITLLSVTK
jgi:hypothetical protein